MAFRLQRLEITMAILEAKLDSPSIAGAEVKAEEYISSTPVGSTAHGGLPIGETAASMAKKDAKRAKKEAAASGGDAGASAGAGAWYSWAA